jgi:hypothetical protein
VCQANRTFGSCSCTGPVADDMAMHSTPVDLAPPPPKRVFVTKTLYTATAAPTACQSSADAAGLGGKWVPWLSYSYSTGNINAIDQVTSYGPWVLITGAQAFRNHGQLGTTPSVPINVTELGTTLPMNELAWTGTVIGGTASVYTCQGWSEVQGIFGATVGNTGLTGLWTSLGDNSTICTDSLHVYCFEL